jgi:hypothetical protein
MEVCIEVWNAGLLFVRPADILSPVFRSFSKVKLRWPHGLKAYVPKTTRPEKEGGLLCCVGQLYFW